ncbi:recombinase family protein [Pseudomonadales bacterium]|nr:recombinase family protein [Pseudomonadales bacterium]
MSLSNIAKDCNELGIPSPKGIEGKWRHNQVDRILFGNQKSVIVTDLKIQPNSHNNSPVLWETIELTEDAAYALVEVGKNFHTTTVGTDMDVDAFLNDLKRYIGNYRKNGVEVVITSLPKFPSEEV